MTYCKTLHYSVTNCGDGSAYPIFFETAELADLHQEYMEEESWGEHCTGTVTLTSESPIECKDITTKKELIQQLKDRDSYLSGSEEELLEILTEES